MNSLALGFGGVGDNLTAMYLTDPKLAQALRKQQYAYNLLNQSQDNQPVISPWQGVNKLAQALLGGYLLNKTDAEVKAAGDAQDKETADFNARIAPLLMGGSSSPAPAPEPAAPPVKPAVYQAPGDLGPLVEQASASSGVPASQLARYLMRESGGDPNAANPTSTARGVAQILQSTAENPGYGVPPLAASDRMVPEKAVPWLANYVAARGKAAGVTDWSDPAQAGKIWQAVGDGTPAAAAVAQAGTPAPANPYAVGPDRERVTNLQNMALEAARSTNPHIRAMAPTLATLAAQSIGMDKDVVAVQTPQGPRYVSKSMAAGMAPALPAESQPRAPERFAQDQIIAGLGKPSVEQKVYGEGAGEGMKLAAQAWGKQRDLVQANTRAEGDFQAFETAMNGFAPGAAADLRLKSKQALSEMGFDTNAPAGEAMKAIQKRLELGISASLLKGQGAITDNERKIAADAVQLFGSTPDGARLIMSGLRSLHEYDKQVQTIYRESARRHGGAPDPVEVDEEISKLPPPAQLPAMRQIIGRIQATQAQNQPGAAAQPPAAAGPSRDDIRKEMIRRGLIRE